MPKIPEGARKERIADELPQSGSGRTIMTTQPQFVPSEAVTVSLSDNAPVRVRLVDSVGYMVRGALGSVDKTGSRMVHTPWYDHDIPFEQAAEVGTRKVMTDHATIGVVVTTDGTIAELPRSAYIEAENRVVSELKALGKPFVIILNSAVPNSPDAQTLRTDLQEAYGVPVMLMSVKDMQSADVQKVLESVLLEFPVRQVRLSVPKWLEALDEGHYLVKEVLTGLKKAGQETHRMRETNLLTPVFAACSEMDSVQLEQLRPGEGRIDLSLTMKDGMFNRILGEECGTEIHGDKHLLRLMKELVAAKTEYDQIAGALKSVRDGLRAGIADDGGDDDGSAGNRAAGRAVRHPPESARPVAASDSRGYRDGSHPDRRHGGTVRGAGAADEQRAGERPAEDVGDVLLRQAAE